MVSLIVKHFHKFHPGRETMNKQKEKEVLSLQKDYDKLSDQTKERKDLAKKLKDDAFAEKYARAKYYYSREGESIYPVPSLLP